MNKAVYIHIPFCRTICSYCDFCKMFYNSLWVSKYLDSLEREIDSFYKNEKVKTIYIGGGTPNCLSLEELENLFKILSKINKEKEYEYTIECNIELLNEEQIKLFKKYNINRVSIGIQTFNYKYLEFLGRNHTKEEVFDKIFLLKKYGIDNINIDLIYALPNQTLKELEYDIDIFLSLNVPHISTYSLIIEPNTILYNKKIKNIDEDIDNDMYNLIIDKLSDYNHYETSNFSKNGYESKHNLTYWNNEFYYGFGLGASGYIGDIRYDNTRNLNKYLNGEYRKDEEYIDFNIKLENEFILGLRKIDGINIDSFNNKYGINILEIKVVKRLLDEKKLVMTDNNIKLNNNYIYLANEVLIEFLGENYEE